MRNVILTVNKTTYDNPSPYTAAWGFGTSASYKYADNDTEYQAGAGGLNVSVFNTLDMALKYLLNIVAQQYQTVAITVVLPEGYVLSDTLKTFLTDKYVLESQIESITFA